MAWNIHWQCCFTSRNGTQYAVNICEQDYSGSIVQLTGAPEPFVTQEEDDDNIFTAIRPQTGYLRVIDTTNNGDLLETIIPANNTEKMVQLLVGTITESGGNITFTTQSGNTAIKWQGFLVAEAFTQPWDKNYKMVELPVKSLLGCLEDLQIPSDITFGDVRVAKMIYDALSATQLTVDNLIIVSDLSGSQAEMLKVMMRLESMFNEEELCEENSSRTEIVGIKYSEILSGILSLYGLQAREIGTNIIFAHYDCPSAFNLGIDVYTWSSLRTIANGGTGLVDQNSLSSLDVLSNFVFAGISNDATFTQGAKDVVIELPIDKNETTFISLPKTDEDSSNYDIVNLSATSGAIIAVQSHDVRTLYSEQFNFYKYKYNSNKEYQQLTGQFNYLDCKADSVMNNMSKMATFPQTNETIVVGSFPCRWYAFLNPTANVRLQNGLYLTNLYKGDQNEILPSDPPVIYNLPSLNQISVDDGYIVLEADCHTFVRHRIVNQLDGEEHIVNVMLWDILDQYGIAMKISIGNYYWNGTIWTNTDAIIQVKFKKGNIDTVNQAGIVTDKKGLIIPINRTLEGYMNVSILANSNGPYSTVPGEDGNFWAFDKIIGNITVTHFIQSSVRGSDRSKNVYKRQIINRGFHEEIKTELTWGTYNNNQASTVFLRNANGDYIETIHFLTGLTEPSSERPEVHLVERMANQYQEVRRTFTGIVRTGIQIVMNKFTYNSRNFFAIDSQHNWREDTQQVKFIEVN